MSTLIIVSKAAIAQLKEQGFYIEDMAKEWGPDYEGQYRWMNHETEEFQQDWSSSPIRAWAECEFDNR